jgi:hypothetical protein
MHIAIVYNLVSTIQSSSEYICLRASPGVLSVGSCTGELDEEKLKHAPLAEISGFWLSIIAEFVNGPALAEKSVIYMI